MNTEELLKYLRSEECTSINYIKTLNKFDITQGTVYILTTDTLFVGFEEVSETAITAVKNMQEQFNVISDSYLYNTTTVYKDNGRTCINFPLCYGMWDEEFDAFSIKTDFALTLNKILKKYLSGIYSIKYSMHIDDIDELVYVLLNITLSNPGEVSFTNKSFNESLLHKLLVSEWFNNDLPIHCSFGKCSCTDDNLYKYWKDKCNFFDWSKYDWSNMYKSAEKYLNIPSFKKTDWKALNESLKENFNNLHKDVASFF